MESEQDKLDIQGYYQNIRRCFYFFFSGKNNFNDFLKWNDGQLAFFIGKIILAISYFCVIYVQ